MQENKVLVAIQVPLLKGIREIKLFLNHIEQVAELEAASCIYKRFLNLRHEDLNSELVCVVKLVTYLDLDALIALFQEAKLEKVGFVLSVNETVRMVPDLTLPHPKLNVDELILSCAAEAWGGYEHPVLKQTLTELLTHRSMNAEVEFFAQGTTLI